MKKDIEINIDFGGFYHSVHSDNIDWKIDQDYEWYLDQNDDNTHINHDKFYDKILWKKTHESYCENYIDMLNNECDLDLKYIGLDSPKYYNYTTDRIIAKIDRQLAVNKLLPITYDKNFLIWANPFLTSRDGFASFYDGIEGLIKKSMDNETDFEILIGTVVDWLIHDHCINENIYDLEYELYCKELITL